MARQVRFREGCNLKTAPSTFAVTNEICSGDPPLITAVSNGPADFSRGLNDRPISVVNEVDDELPPGLSLDDLTTEAKDRKNWQEAASSFIFGTEMRYDDGVERPMTPQLPEEFQDTPHAYLVTLNHGCC